MRPSYNAGAAASFANRTAMQMAVSRQSGGAGSGGTPDKAGADYYAPDLRSDAVDLGGSGLGHTALASNGATIAMFSRMTVSTSSRVATCSLIGQSKRVLHKREGQDDFWLAIGAAFMHQDGDGYNVVLQALPIDGKIVLRLPKGEEQTSETHPRVVAGVADKRR